MTFAEANAWRDRFADVPYEDKGGSHPGRYYQDIAIERVMQAIANDRQRILLTLATGTGKTFIAFQIAWKLFHSRWNLGREATRRPRILFLADRNNLANQAFNAFSAFPEDALVRISPEDIRKKGKVPMNGSLFFTIFQTFMSGRGGDGKPAPYFGDYPPDFFDFIVIDECHRGGANDESNWRGILEYFAPAVQLGLTATPKRRKDKVACPVIQDGVPVQRCGRIGGHGGSVFSKGPDPCVHTPSQPMTHPLPAHDPRPFPNAEPRKPIPERTVPQSPPFPPMVPGGPAQRNGRQRLTRKQLYAKAFLCEPLSTFPTSCFGSSKPRRRCAGRS